MFVSDAVVVPVGVDEIDVVWVIDAVIDCVPLVVMEAVVVAE